MLPFEFKNPTKIRFGKGQIEKLGKQVPKNAKIMMLYGGGSIKKNGIYEKVITALNDFEVVEFGGIPANPEYEILLKALDVIKRENIAKVNQIDSKVDMKNEHIYVYGMEQLKLNDCIRKFTQTDESQSHKKDSLFKMIKELIKKGVDLNAEDKTKETAFFAATRSESKELISLFLENKKLDINHLNIYKETALFSPVNNGLRNLDIILLFLQNGANPNLKNIRGQSAIEMLINIILHLQNKKKSYPRITDKLDMNGEYVTILENILDSSKVKLDQLNSFGKPLFFDVVLHYNYALFKIMINKGVNINQKDNKGQNILFNLLNKDINNTIKDRTIYLDALQNLLNLGIDINEKDDNGNTVIHLAVANKCEYTVKLFLEAKPDFLIQDKKGRSIIHNCIWKDTTRYFKLIHSYNKDIINISDDLGVRPINYAAFMGKKKLVLDMLEAGALVNNTSKIDKSIISFFKKFHDKILNIDKNEKSQVNIKNLKLLAYNMKKEFLIQANT